MPEAIGDPGEITVYLRRLSRGDASAEVPLAEAVYSQLRKTAQAIVRSGQNDVSLQATSLVNVVLLELLRARTIEWHDREHFLRSAARLLRRRFIDYIRARRAGKRPSSGLQTDFEELLLPTEERFDEILDVHAALQELASFDPELAELVELVYFGGCPLKTIAEIRGVSTKTVSRHLGMAQNWLRDRLSRPFTLKNSA